MKAISLILAMLVLAMVFKALESLTCRKRTENINIDNPASIRRGLAHYKDLED